METNNTASGYPANAGPRRLNERAWIENQVLATELSAAQQRLTRAEEAGSPESRLRRLRRDVERAAEAIYLGNRALARKLAGRYERRGSESDDLHQVADEALWKAIQSWDPEASPLANWAYLRINKACRLHVARNEHDMSAWTWEQRPAILQAAQQLRDAGKNPDPARVASIAGVTTELAMHVLSRHHHGAPRSLDAPVGEGGSTFAEILDLEGALPASDADDDDEAFLDTVAELTADLSIVDLFVWIRTHGVDHAPPWSTEVIEQLLGVSAETVRRAARRADDKVAAAAQKHTAVVAV